MALAAACGPGAPTPSPEAPARGSAGILGGAIAPDDPEVFMLAVEFSTGATTTCTATLIGARTLLTAAHCVDPRVVNATGVSLRATNAVDAAAAGPAAWIGVGATRTCEAWNPFRSLDHDLALVLLDEAPDTSPKPWNRASVDGLAGKSVRVLGYGVTAKGDDDSGVRRQVTLEINSAGPAHLFLGDGEGRGICHGDSGGPTYRSFPDGVERVVGVHSYDANQKCTSGADVRVDAYADFVDAWMAQYEPRACLEPCPPEDCTANGVCAVEACETPDPDCVPTGAPCERADQCQGRRCVSDPQNEEPYCSLPCATSAACPEGMECAASGVCLMPQAPTALAGEVCVGGVTFCAGGLVCAGPEAGQTRCTRGCALTSECAKGTCEIGAGGVRYCRETPQTQDVIAVPDPTLPAAGGCSSGGGGPWALGAWAIAWVAATRRRRMPLPGGARAR